MFEFSSKHHFVLCDVTTTIPIIINQSWYVFFWSSPKSIMQIISTTVKGLQGEFVKQSKASSIGDHFLYSHDLNVWFRGDTVRRN